MTRDRRRAWRAAVAITGAIACGCGGSAKPVSLDEFAAEFTSVSCERFVQCDYINDASLCPVLVSTLARQPIATMGAAVAAAKAGKARYDGSAVAACLRDVAATDCAALFSAVLPVSCQGVFRGILAEGDRCISDVECPDETFCSLPMDVNGRPTCDGLCMGGGIYCNESKDCAQGLVCDPSLQSGVSRGSCDTPTPPGAAGGPCGSSSTCQTGLHCNGTRCVAKVEAGQACTFSGIGTCVDGYFCVSHQDGTPATCVPPAGRGEGCVGDQQCAGLFLSTMACDPTTHVCVDAPSTGPCAGTGMSRCDPLTAYCDLNATPPTCKPFAAPGDPCSPGVAGECRTSSSSGPGLACAPASATSASVCVAAPVPTCAP